MFTAKKLTPTLLALLMVPLACTKKLEPEGYRIVAYDARIHQWTILRTGTFDGKYLRKRLTVVCSWYKWGDHERVTGPEACDLQVGRKIIPNPLPPPEKRREFLDVSETSAETLSITEGVGANRVMQQFAILKYEVLPDNDSQ
jgi:hypothetical protein